MEGDSFDYEVLERAAQRVRDVSGLVCEIGTRRGGSLKYIMDGLEGTRKHIVCIDPYGDIGYNGADNQINVRYDYTNCNDPLWNDLKEQADLLDKEIKDRERFLKTIPPSGLTITDHRTGEIVTIRPALKTSTTTPVITWKH